MLHKEHFVPVKTGEKTINLIKNPGGLKKRSAVLLFLGAKVR